MGRLVVVTGVGTGIGKTHLAVALVHALAKRDVKVAGYKPIESGIEPGVVGDADRLLAASRIKVEPAPLFGFRTPVSPHLAAELEERPIDPMVIRDAVERARESADVTVVELAGGLFSPLSRTADNADLLAHLASDLTLLVAEDCLGVLHHVRATALAAKARGAGGFDVALVEPKVADASTGRNADFLAANHRIHLVPRADSAVLAASPQILALAERVLGS
jgi:dethiobiotin synthetase